MCELAAAQSQAGNFMEAENLFARALRINPSDAQTNYNMATVKIELRKFTEAINFAKNAVDSVPSNAVYVYTLGLACEGSGANEVAITAYKTAASLDQRYIRPRINLGNLFQTAGNFNDAITYLNEAYAIEPGNFEVNNNLGAVYSKQRNWSYSIVHYERALVAMPNDAVVRFNLARAYAGAGDLEKAQSSYQAVLRLTPENWDAMFELGKTCFTLGQHSDARRYLQDLINRNPGYSGKAEAESILASL
jgi:tetratricopeptide (TPR) repeat protein